MAKKLGDLILEKLRKAYKLDLSEFIAPRLRGKSLFEFIIGVMLSQNTSDKNAIRAYQRLLARYGNPLKPVEILKRGIEDLMDAIKPAGMYRVRARNIYELAKLFAEPGFEEEIKEKIEKAGIEEGRRILMSLPGIGVKSADVILSQYFGKQTFPVDTHIRRITNRLGYIKSNNYMVLSKWWMENTSPENYVELHLLLITHGRRTCRARNPLCNNCPIRELCRYGDGRGA